MSMVGGMNATSDLLERYAQDIAGVLGCFNRVVVTGTLTEVAHPEAMAAVLRRERVRCFDIGLFAEPLRGRIRDNALEVARAGGVEVERNHPVTLSLACLSAN